MNDTLQVIKSRRSIRDYKNTQIKDEELQDILEAGLYAPSAINQQSWHFTVLQNRQIMDEISREVKDGFLKSDNPKLQEFANKEDFDVFHHALTAIIISGDENTMAPQADCAAAAQNMLLAAQSLGLGSCWANMPVSVFDEANKDQWKNQLGIPQGYKPLYCTILGYKAVGDVSPAPRKENPINYVK